MSMTLFLANSMTNKDKRYINNNLNKDKSSMEKIIKIVYLHHTTYHKIFRQLTRKEWMLKKDIN